MKQALLRAAIIGSLAVSGSLAQQLPFRPEEKEQLLKEAERAIENAKLSLDLEERAKLLGEGDQARLEAGERAIQLAKQRLKEVGAVVPPAFAGKQAAQAPPAIQPEGDPVLEDKPAKAPTKKPGPAEPMIELQSYGDSSFSAKDRIFIFQKNVSVKHPAFTLLCDKLEIFRDELGEIQTAIATGGLVTIKGLDNKGQPVEAKCQMAVYTKDKLTLRKWPQVKRGKLISKASSAETIMDCFLKDQDIQDIKVRGPVELISPESGAKSPDNKKPAP